MSFTLLLMAVFVVDVKLFRASSAPAAGVVFANLVFWLIEMFNKQNIWNYVVDSKGIGIIYNTSNPWPPRYLVRWQAYLPMSVHSSHWRGLPTLVIKIHGRKNVKIVCCDKDKQNLITEVLPLIERRLLLR